MTAQTYTAMPPITLEDKPQAHPLRTVFVTVLSAKILIAALLVANVSLAPPMTQEHSYMTLASN